MTSPIQPIAFLPPPTGVPATDAVAAYNKINELVGFANGVGSFVASLIAQGEGQYLTLQDPNSNWVTIVPVVDQYPKKPVTP